MRKRFKISKQRSKKLFKKTARPVVKNRQKTGVVRRGGIRL